MPSWSIRWEADHEQLITAAGVVANQPRKGVPEFTLALKSTRLVALGDPLSALQEIERFSQWRTPAGRAQPELAVINPLPFVLRSTQPRTGLGGPYRRDDHPVAYDIYFLSEDSQDLLIEIEPVLIELYDEKELLTATQPLVDLLNIRILTAKTVRDEFNHNVVQLTLSAPHSALIETVALFSRAVHCIAFSGQIPDRSMNVGLQSILAFRGSTLLGQSESVDFDAKRDPYNFSSNQECHNYAVDLAAFANSSTGGMIVIGAATKRDEFGRDVVVSLPGISSRKNVDLRRYAALAESRITPTIEGLLIELVETDMNPLLAIAIPPQALAVQPFVVKGAALDTGKISGSAITVPIRRGSSNHAMTAESLQVLLSAGRVKLNAEEHGATAGIPITDQ